MAENPLSPDDLIQGLQDWRNIQDIVRLTFRAINDVVKTQGRTIAQLEKKLEDKCSRGEVRVRQHPHVCRMFAERVPSCSLSKA
jgi:hypothetical protein